MVINLISNKEDKIMGNQERVTTASGVKMPGLIYGTAWKKDRTADLVVTAIQAGFRGIDTACQPKHYREPLIGTALQRLKDRGIKREALFIQTKFTSLDGQDPTQVPYDKDASLASQVAQSFETSKKNLQTEYLDALILHSPMPRHAQLMEVWAAMEIIKKAGGARLLGISNCYNTEVLKQLYAEAYVKPAIVQNRFYGETGYDTDLRNWCAKHGVVYQSFWTLTANPHILESHTIRTMALNHQKTEAQIFFRYLNQTSIIPLTGTCSEQHMKEDLSIQDFELSSDELKKVSSLLIQK
jgi:diketogulonate reductase-like aldo/keto reductase